jgi:hypothetical protein
MINYNPDKNFVVEEAFIEAPIQKLGSSRLESKFDHIDKNYLTDFVSLLNLSFSFFVEYRKIE